MNNVGNPRKRLTQQRDIAVSSNTSSLTVSLVLPAMPPTLIVGSTLSCAPLLLGGRVLQYLLHHDHLYLQSLH